MAATKTIIKIMEIVSGVYEADAALDASNNATDIILKRSGQKVMSIPNEELDDLLAVIKAIPR